MMRNLLNKSLAKKVVCLLMVAAFSFSIASPTASALSQQDLDSIYKNTVWYKPSGGGADTGTGAATPTPGVGAPDGAQFPNLDPDAMTKAINIWITKENPSSKLSGLGETIVASSKNSNINPFLIVAIAKKESNMADPGDYNVITGGNAYGRSATDRQPHFRGDMVWYWWSSTKASVDYTAPENKGAIGGGDMPAYIREKYGSKVDSNNFVSLITEYAPPTKNNTALYIAQVQSWLDELVQLAVGQASKGTTDSANGGGTCSADCAQGAASGNAAILCEAKKYEGIYYKLGGGHSSYSTFRQGCPEGAIAAAAASSTAADPGPCSTDCSGLVSVAVDAAFNLSFIWTIGGGLAGAGSQYWKSIPIDQVQPGDIVTTDEHVEIVDHIEGNSVVTFGSHHTGTKTGNVTTSLSYWSTGAYRFTIPPAGGN